jgi:hypothetical protein
MKVAVSGMVLLFAVVSTPAETLATRRTNAKDADRLRVLHDSGLIGALGTFQGPGDTVELSIAPPIGAAPEGTKVLQAICQVGPGGWAGLFIKPGTMEQDKVIDASRFAKDGELRFWISSTRDVQIGIRSRNIAPGAERSKLWLRREKLAKLEGRWEHVCIELRRFAALEERLRFSEMQVMLMVAVTADGSGSGQCWVAIDDVAWFFSPDSRVPPRRSAPLPVDLGVADFLANDYQGGSCKLSNADGQLEEGHSRPSSGSCSTVLDLKAGTVNFRWDHPGLGHGYQIVFPFGDPRYPARLERWAGELQRWAYAKVTSYEPEPRTSSLPAETQTRLKTAATNLLTLREVYPKVAHHPEKDAVWEGEGTNTLLRLRATASKAFKLEVIGEIVTKESVVAPKADREAADPEVRRRERRTYSFGALFPFPPPVYEEAVGQVQLRQLRRFEMTPVEGGFEVRIPIWRQGNQFQYAIVAQGESNRATVCLPEGQDVFVLPE